MPLCPLCMLCVSVLNSPYFPLAIDYRLSTIDLISHPNPATISTTESAAPATR
jgi:hypothetical protein